MRESDTEQSQTSLSVRAGAEVLVRADGSRTKENQRKRTDKFSDELLQLRVHEDLTMSTILKWLHPFGRWECRFYEKWFSGVKGQ
jgi:hypothetical protein